MKKFFPAVLSLFFMVFLCVSVVRVEEASAAVRVIRVGLVEQPREKDGFAYQMLLSYVRGYLSEVAKQTRWQYLYESGSYQECMERLRRGELDFVAPVQPGPETAGMVFTGGVPNWTLLHLYWADDSHRQPLTSETAKDITVGLIANEVNLNALSFFKTKNDWQVNVRLFSDGQSMRAALHAGEIDAVCDDGTHVGSEERLGFTFSVVPARIMTTPDKEALCGQLTEAILTIESLNPGFGTSLKGKYVDRALQAIVRPTESGRRYVESAKELRVAFLTDCAPFYEIKGNTPETSSGFYIDMLKLVADVSGLRFTFCQADSESRLWKMLTSGEADLAFVSYVNEISAADIYYTGDVREEEFSVIRRKEGKVQPSAQNVAVVPAGFPGADQFFSQKHQQQVRTLESPEKCLDAVDRGLCEIAYIPSLYLRRESSMVLWSGLERIDRESTSLPVALALSPKQPHILQNVLNAAILRMDRNEVERLARENARPRFSLGYLLYWYPLRMTLFICFLIASLAVLVFVLYRNWLQRKQNEILRKKNEDLKVALHRVEAMRISRDGYKLESETDKLTTVFNKIGFENTVRKMMTEMLEGNEGAFYIMDIDHFKEANDTYGHQCGDEILQKFSAVLKEVFRKSDCIGRFGGDEFVVFIVGALTREAVENKARQMLESVRNITVGNKDIKITTSIGIAMYPEHGTNYDYLFNAADRALYKVKSRGRDGYAVAYSDV